MREVTVDWRFPKEEAHGHYRGYGRDFLQRFPVAEPDAQVLQIEAVDEVTGAGGYIYLWSADATLIHHMKEWIANPVVVG